MAISVAWVNIWTCAISFDRTVISLYFSGYLGMIERMTGRDINGDGYLGRRPDVLPGYPAVYGHPSYVYGSGGRVYATNQYVPRRHY